MVGSVDEHVGKRLYRRRRMLGLTQEQLARCIGIRFQQIQKYECGLNRVNASRLFQLAGALKVSPDYFFEGLSEAPLTRVGVPNVGAVAVDLLNCDETLDLIRAYYELSALPRRRLLDLAISLQQ